MQELAQVTEAVAICHYIDQANQAQRYGDGFLSEAREAWRLTGKKFGLRYVCRS